MKKAWVIKDDNQRCIPHFYFDTFVDKENPRIEVTITELTAGQAKMTLKDLLKDLETGVMAWQTEKAVLSCIRSICDTYRK